MTVKIKSEASLTIDETDLASILTEHFCGSAYDVFADLRVEMISHDKQNRDFTISLSPKPQPEEQA